MLKTACRWLGRTPVRGGPDIATRWAMSRTGVSIFPAAIALSALPLAAPAYADPPSPRSFSDCGSSGLVVVIPAGDAVFGATAAEQGFVDIGAGYQINHFFRADVTAEYRFPSQFKTVETYGSQAAGYFGSDYYRGNISNAVFLVNGYVDLGTYCHVTPYLGAGVGTSINIFSGVTDYNLSYNGQASGSSASNTKASFAYALMAGFSYDLTQNLKLDFGYRYLDMGRLATGEINCYGGSSVCGDNSRERQSYHLASHDIRLGLRYVFADVAPIPQYAPQLPLIRKY